ncbi:VOC family protein [Actinoplanes sp. LDG1-06]|uniref:VOC family protein n=1 Tax=Paractinoplanes ovalisporus TaxID=2810368 RepID=A0ABS2AVK1_9ACTN|nr:VOC family protein [Actinoplanes ovalisporus]MBM2623179.1 VOC family protein [Actinoplanes ovalisporus]
MPTIWYAAQEPRRLAQFWSDLVGDDLAIPLRFFPIDEPRPGPNLAHLHLTSESQEHQDRTVARALELGAHHLDVGQKPEEGHIVLADPEGNEFCVIEPGNNYLAGTGFVGELSCDGSRATGLFYSAALGWPLVWDQNEETAIQSPQGGMKIAWGGPPQAPRLRPDRVLLEIEADPDRLLTLGATYENGEWSDPDGTRFRLTSRY